MMEAEACCWLTAMLIDEWWWLVERKMIYDSDVYGGADEQQ